MSYDESDNDSFDGSCPSCGQTCMRAKIKRLEREILTLREEREYWFEAAKEAKQELANALAEIVRLTDDLAASRDSIEALKDERGYD